jgi:CheY-like chemotaxis protein
MRVLLVDDNPVNVSVASLMLERLGYRVDAVTDGQQAIDAAAARDYTAILMDCEMPVLDGYAATAEIRRGHREVRVPIIAMTANITEIDRQRCLDAGMDDFVSKPILMDVLRAALERWAPRLAD